MELLQNRDKFIKSIKKNALLYYEKHDITKEEAVYSNGWGALDHEEVRNGYFRHTTGFVDAYKIPAGHSYVVQAVGRSRELIKITNNHLIVPVGDKFQVFNLTDNLEFVYETCQKTNSTT